MNNIESILGLSALFVFGFLSMAMAMSGIRKGKVYHTSGRPPIIFREKPIKFVVWTVCLIIISLACLKGALTLAVKFIEN